MKLKILLAVCGAGLLILPTGQAFASNKNYFDTLAVADTEAVVYAEADEEAEAEARVSSGETLAVRKRVREEGETTWYKVTYGEDGEKGYVKAENLLVGESAEDYLFEEETLYATTKTGEPAAVYLEPDAGGPVVYQLLEDEFCPVTGHEGDFAVIESENDFVGYVLVDEAAFTTKEKGSVTRDSLVETALRYVGGRYVWGGESLTNGVDCSGFTMKIFAMYGISLPHSSAAQSKMGKKVSSYSDLLPGDLIFYGQGGKVGHVAIYIGDGKIVHAANAKKGIIVSNWNYQKPITMRRFLE